MLFSTLTATVRSFSKRAAAKVEATPFTDNAATDHLNYVQ